MTETSFVVLKFGGTSVSKREYWMIIAEAVRQCLRQGQRPILVCSALSKVSDQLHQLVDEVGIHPGELVRVDTILSRYQNFAEELGVSGHVLQASFDTLRRLTQGVALLGESSPGVRAHIMAFGELMLTQLGAEFLRAQGLDTHWQDVREWFQSTSDSALSEEQNVLSAVCPYQFDGGLVAKLGEITNPVVITQGFIAKDERGRTVLLGRGGSDTSAAYLAAKIGAKKCEIWTDVPGIYTTNPAWVPDARLIKKISYEEAREIALGGAKVLHPYCIDPLMASEIPLLIKCTPNPHQESTVISSRHDQSTHSGVKAISLKRGVCLISMETTDMWRQVGFLANVFECFRKHGISINLVATAENNVTVTLDVVNHLLSRESITHLIGDLEKYCSVKFVESCAVISLVGSRIRSILHKLATVFSVFDEQKIYLLTQATNDLNLSLVVEESEAENLLRKMHANLFEQGNLSSEFGTRAQGPASVATSWWRTEREGLLELAKEETPLYVYSEAVLKASALKAKSLTNVSQIFYAMKANSNPQVLKVLHKEGLGLECVSIGELQRVLEVFPDIEPKQILFTPNFAERKEYEAAFRAKVWVNLDNLHPLECWPEIFAGKSIFLRMDTGIAQGHHQHVKTGGKRSKFGISPTQLPRLKEILRVHDIKVVGLHAHMGSGVMNPESWCDVGLCLGEIAKNNFPFVAILNVGGGLGVPEKSGDPELSLKGVEASLATIKAEYPDYELWIEPGRFLVAEAGVLLAQVTQLKQKEDVHFVGINTGMNSLIRPALYGAYHEIVNLTRISEPATKEVHLVGPICESGDTLGHNRLLPPGTEEGDVMLIATTGAYGYVMGSHYNLRAPAREVSFRL